MRVQRHHHHQHLLTQDACNICRRIGSGSNKKRDKYRNCAYTCVSHTYYPLSCPFTSSTPLFFCKSCWVRIRDEGIQLENWERGGYSRWKRKGEEKDEEKDEEERKSGTAHTHTHTHTIPVQEVEKLHQLDYYYSVCSLYIDGVLVTLTSIPKIHAGTNINANLANNIQNEPFLRRQADLQTKHHEQPIKQTLMNWGLHTIPKSLYW